MNTFSVVPQNAQFMSGGKPISMPSSRRIVRVNPQGGSSGYNPETNNTIKMSLSPSLGFMDGHQSFMSFRIRPIGCDLTKECRMDKCAMSWLRRFKFDGPDGSNLEDIDHYNLAENLLDAATAPPSYSETIGRALDNAGSIAARNARAAHPAGYKYCSGFNLSGILNGESEKLLPLSFMNGEMTMELTLAPFKECWVGTPAVINGVTQTMSYQIDNVEFHAHCLTFGEDYNKKFQDQLLEKGIDLSYSTFRTHNSVLTNSSMDLMISQNSSSVKGVYHVLRSKNKVNSASYDSLSTFKSSNLKSIQWSMGSVLTPTSPLMLENMGTTSLYAHNLQSFNMFRNLSLGSGISDNNFSSTELTSGVAAGLVGGVNAYQALPLRRIYGTWVANGKEEYGLRQQTISGVVFDTDTGAPQSEEGVLSFSDITDLAKSRAIEGEYLEQRLRPGSYDPTGRVLLDGTADTFAYYSHTVPTLSFVPNNARDIGLLELGMRCKIGCATAPRDVGLQSEITGTTVYGNLSEQELGLDRFYRNSPENGYTAGSREADKNTQYEADSANVMYPGNACTVTWGFPRTPGTMTQAAIPEAYVSGIGIPFVDGLNRPILSNQVGISFEGWVECLADDSQFFLGCNFESAQESPELISGSNLTGSTPLIVKLNYDNTENGITNFHEGRDNSDLFTSFVHIDAVLRITDSGNVISSQ